MLILDHLNQYHPLSNCQWGFQAKKSSVSALISTTHNCLQQLEAGKEIGAVFFDFKKAFDKVPQEHLMSKFVSLGLDPHILTWLHNCLTNRKQRVVVNGTTSTCTHAKSGVPQGSILGPLLFVIYIDSIASLSFSPDTRIVLYVDDILLYRPISSESDLRQLQSDVDAIQQWVSRNYMKLNASKCKYMLVSRKQNRAA